MKNSAHELKGDAAAAAGGASLCSNLLEDSCAQWNLDLTWVCPKLRGTEIHTYFDEEKIWAIWPIWGYLFSDKATSPALGCPWPQQVRTGSTEADALNGTTTLFSDRTCGIKAGVSTSRNQKRVLKSNLAGFILFNHQTKWIEPVNLGSSLTMAD